jgi:TPR repeat protein
MECSKCSTEVADSARFCPQCGCSQADTEDLRQRCLADVKECERAVTTGDGSRPYIRHNFDNRLVEWTRAAELGVREAQWLLARCYDEGFGVERNEIRAVSWHLKAAEQGYAPAQNHLGSCYQNGDSVPQDDAEAVEWYRRAADQGYAIAQANLGWCHDTGTGVARDEAEAAQWYRKAAEQGDYTSQFNLAVHYEWGSSVGQDKQEAIKWYRKAADQGYVKAAEALEKLTSEVAAEQKDRQEKAKASEERFRKACKEVLAEGTLALDESDRLRVLGDLLKVSDQLRNQFFEQEKKIFLQDQKAQPSKDAELRFRIACKNAISDGKVTLDEKDELRKLGNSLNLSREVMKRLFDDERGIFKTSQRVRPTRSVELQFRKACKKVLADGKVTPDEEHQIKSLARFFKMPNDVMKQIFADEVKIYRQSRGQTPTKSALLQFSKACKEALADGKVTPEEENQLKSLAKFLKIPNETMKRIFAHEAKLYQKTHVPKPST